MVGFGMLARELAVDQVKVGVDARRQRAGNPRTFHIRSAPNRRRRRRRHPRSAHARPDGYRGAPAPDRRRASPCPRRWVRGIRRRAGCARAAAPAEGVAARALGVGRQSKTPATASITRAATASTSPRPSTGRRGADTPCAPPGRACAPFGGSRSIAASIASGRPSSKSVAPVSAFFRCFPAWCGFAADPLESVLDVHVEHDRQVRPAISDGERCQLDDTFGIISGRAPGKRRLT